MLAAPWRQVFEETLIEEIGPNSIRGHFAINPLNCWPSFGVLMVVAIASAITVRLRFGFSEADADNSIVGLDFRQLTAMDESDFGSVFFRPAGPAPPDRSGNFNTTLPPIVTVRASHPPFEVPDLRYRVFTCEAFCA